VFASHFFYHIYRSGSCPNLKLVVPHAVIVQYFSIVVVLPMEVDIAFDRLIKLTILRIFCSLEGYIDTNTVWSRNLMLVLMSDDSGCPCCNAVV
jgi:hypothetical protein